MKRKNDIQISDHFWLYEFECKDGSHQVVVQPELVEKLEILRAKVSERLGKDTPLIINSGYRNEKHNEAVGGAPSSQHLYGTASDVQLPIGLTVDEFAELGEQSGFHGIGLYYARVHFDVRGYKARWDTRK